VLRGGLGTGSSGNGSHGVTFEHQTFRHHSTMKALEESEAIVGCSICKALANELRKREKLVVAQDEQIGIEARIYRLKDRDSLAIRGVSGNLAENPHMYQLDFVEEKTNTVLRTFALKPTSKSVPKLLHWAYMGCYYIFRILAERGCIVPSFHFLHYNRVKALRTRILLMIW
jgi:hypothetical protein